MGNLSPGQDYNHLLDRISGFDLMHDLQYKAQTAAGEDFRRGALVSLNATGKFVAGLSVNWAMPLWAINDVNDFDANSDVGNVSGDGPAAYVATGGYELATTEFDKDATYHVNALLTNDTVTAGYVTPAPNPGYSTVMVLGVVSKGEYTDTYNQSVLQFWPVYLPPYSS
jgi:hypothetical protein